MRGPGGKPGMEKEHVYDKHIKTILKHFSDLASVQKSLTTPTWPLERIRKQLAIFRNK